MYLLRTKLNWKSKFLLKVTFSVSLWFINKYKVSKEMKAFYLKDLFKRQSFSLNGTLACSYNWYIGRFYLKSRLVKDNEKVCRSYMVTTIFYDNTIELYILYNTDVDSCHLIGWYRVMWYNIDMLFNDRSIVMCNGTLRWGDFWPETAR